MRYDLIMRVFNAKKLKSEFITIAESLPKEHLLRIAIVNGFNENTEPLQLTEFYINVLDSNGKIVEAYFTTGADGEFVLGNEKLQLKKRFKLPSEKIIIGSFQKDGIGWGEGLEPKLIKGPDIFCEVVKKLADDFNIHIFLTGPARGYVKKRLSSSGIPFKHVYFKNPLDVAQLYKALDLYLISSRTEGGPKALLESFASRVPLVSTDVGMVHDLGRDGYNAMISKVDDIDNLVYNCQKTIDDENLRKKIISGGFQTVKDYDWKVITRRYYEEIYSRFL